MIVAMTRRNGVYSDEDMMRIFWPLYFTGVVDPPIGSGPWNVCAVFLSRFRQEWQPLIRDMEEDLPNIDDMPIDITHLMELENNDEMLGILRNDAIAVLNQLGLALAVYRHNPSEEISDVQIKITPRT